MRNRLARVITKKEKDAVIKTLGRGEIMCPFECALMQFKIFNRYYATSLIYGIHMKLLYSFLFILGFQNPNLLM